MLGEALAVLAAGRYHCRMLFRAINPEVMVFLFGMFVVGQALVESGYLSVIAGRLFSRVKTTDHLVLVLLFGTGLLSALLMNDTLAIIGTPLVLTLAAGTRTPPKLLLLALTIAITTGSVMSPIGNPQNLLVAVNFRDAGPVRDIRVVPPPFPPSSVLGLHLLFSAFSIAVNSPLPALLHRVRRPQVTTVLWFLPSVLSPSSSFSRR